MYDVIIVGAGPAGLFAAYELIGKRILVVDMGLGAKEREKEIKNRHMFNGNASNIMSGVGGAGLFSDGKLNFTPILGKTNLLEFMEYNEAYELIKYTEIIFNKFGMNGKTYPSSMEKALKLKDRAKRNGIDLLIIKQKHLGSDMLPKHIEKFVEFLKSHGVDIRTKERVENVIAKDGRIEGVKTNKDMYHAKNVIIAPGRSGAEWFQREAARLGLKMRYRGIEVGVRVEVPNEIMDDVTDIIYDPTFFIYTDTYDDQVRTFCTNKGGFVVKEQYEDFVCVNGHAFKNKKSNNTNFAFLSKIDLTEPVTDTLKYGTSIGKLSTTIGGGKPIIQRFIDLKKGRRSTWKRIGRSYVTPTLKDVTPGDIGMAMPSRIVTNIIEGLEKLNSVIPGIASNSTLLYAPEIKFFNIRVDTNNKLETEIEGLYVAGDGVGVSGNIVGAAATGIIAARAIKNKA